MVLLLLLSARAAEPSPLTTVAEAAAPHLVALVVEHHGRVVFSHRGRDGVSRERDKTADPALHDIRSAGKSITALVVGAAVDDGLLSTDTAVWPLLGSDDPRYAQVTVHDLLTMSSPLDCDDHHRRSPGHEERMYRAPVWREFALTLPFDTTFGRGPSGQGRFAYCTAGVFLLGQAVEAVTGEPFDAYAQRRLFDPLDIHDVVWRRSSAGEVQTGGQLGIRPTDLAKLGRLVLDGGEWQGQRLLSEAWIQTMLTPYHGSGPEHAYGYLWWFRTFDHDDGPQPSAVMSGNGGNLVALFRERDAVVVVQSAAYNKRWADERSAALVEAALAALPK